MNYKKEEADTLLTKLGITLKVEDKDKDGKALLKVNIDTIYFYVSNLYITHDELFLF